MKNEGRTARVNYVCKPQEKKMLELIADAYDMKMSDLIRRLIAKEAKRLGIS